VLFGGPDVLRSLLEGSLIACLGHAGVLTQPTPRSPTVLPTRADLALGVGCGERGGSELAGPVYTLPARTASKNGPCPTPNQSVGHSAPSKDAVRRWPDVYRCGSRLLVRPSS